MSRFATHYHKFSRQEDFLVPVSQSINNNSDTKFLMVDNLYPISRNSRQEICTILKDCEIYLPVFFCRNMVWQLFGLS